MVCIMNKCVNCHIWILDDTEVCPLCNSVVEVAEEYTSQDKEQLSAEEVSFLKRVERGVPYPDVRKRTRLLQFVMRMVLFLFIVVEVGLVILNRVLFHGIWWSAICGIAMLYSYFCTVYWLRHDSGHASKIGLQLILTIVLVMGIDYFSGWNGWSIQWAIPCIVPVGDAIVFILMMTDRKQWYSYTLLLLLIVIFSCGMIFLYLIGRISHVVLVLVSAGVTFAYLLGTFIFGDREIKRELKRRFRV